MYFPESDDEVYEEAYDEAYTQDSYDQRAAEQQKELLSGVSQGKLGWDPSMWFACLGGGVKQAVFENIYKALGSPRPSPQHLRKLAESLVATLMNCFVDQELFLLAQDFPDYYEILEGLENIFTCSRTAAISAINGLTKLREVLSRISDFWDASDDEIRGERKRPLPVNRARQRLSLGFALRSLGLLLLLLAPLALADIANKEKAQKIELIWDKQVKILLSELSIKFFGI